MYNFNNYMRIEYSIFIKLFASEAVLFTLRVLLVDLIKQAVL